MTWTLKFRGSYQEVRKAVEYLTIAAYDLPVECIADNATTYVDITGHEHGTAVAAGKVTNA